MARRPLLNMSRFDIENVVDYGTRFYDKYGDGCCDLEKGKPTMPKNDKMKPGKYQGGWKKKG